MSSFLGQTKLNRGIRNNNPGNLVKTSITWLGKVPHSKNTDSRFEQFTSVEYGIRAMLRDVVNDMNKGNNTITKLIHQYAPPFENDTVSYINDVSKGLGIAPDAKISVIDNDFLLKVAKAIIKKENAPHHTYITDKHIKSAINMLGTFSKTTVKVDVKKSVIASLVVPVLLFFFTVFTISL
jgi:hypothetical protein